MSEPKSLILLTGGTGYVGGRLLTVLEREGYPVRCLARKPDYLEPKVSEQTEVVAGDVLDSKNLDSALQGVDSAYYLVHSMGSAGSFEKNDREGARLFGEAAKKAGVRRIVYLGGLGDESKSLSKHLRSRHEVGHILRESGVPVLEFRASIVIGEGSLSYEMIRSLVNRLPVMITPKWVSRKAQPIAIDDLIKYLLAALELPLPKYGIYEIGGADQVSYGDIMQAYARSKGRHIKMIPVPFLSPYLSSLWLGLVTPLYARIGRKLIKSIIHSTVVKDDSANSSFDIIPIGIEEAIRHANMNEDAASNRWSDAQSSVGPSQTWEDSQFKPRLMDSRTITVEQRTSIAFQPIEKIGGETGWYACNWLWQIRGFLDLLFGGAGMRRGRPNHDKLIPGDTIDFWRVEQFESDRYLRLRAEMKLPGRAWLEFEVTPEGTGSRIRQTALFDPVGLVGKIYWYSLFPLHQIVFAGMLRGIAKAAQSSERATTLPE